MKLLCRWFGHKDIRDPDRGLLDYVCKRCDRRFNFQEVSDATHDKLIAKMNVTASAQSRS